MLRHHFYTPTKRQRQTEEQRDPVMKFNSHASSIGRALSQPTSRRFFKAQEGLYFEMGEMNIEFCHCKAFHFIHEQLINSLKSTLQFVAFFGKGKHMFEPVHNAHPFVKELFSSEYYHGYNFLQNVRAYNNSSPWIL